jgi:hypothetical protein
VGLTRKTRRLHENPQVTPRQFFDDIAEENAQLAIAARHDLRLAINAIMTLDAFFGILHATLHEKHVAGVPRDDDKWKDTLAQQSDEYRLLRDAAFALKHGNLTRATPRLVNHPKQLFLMPGAFQTNAVQVDAFQTEQIWIETPAADHKADEVIGKVADFARLQLTRFGM